MAYTRTDDPRAALIRLADAVPVVVVVVVVTCGGQGSIVIDSTTREEEWVPSLPVNAVDATGAGDVFAAAFGLAALRHWPLRNRLAFANLCAALSVQQSAGRWPRPAGATSPTGCRRSGARPRPVHGQPACCCTVTGSRPAAFRPARRRQSAGPAPPSPDVGRLIRDRPTLSYGCAADVLEQVQRLGKSPSVLDDSCGRRKLLIIGGAAEHPLGEPPEHTGRRSPPWL